MAKVAWEIGDYFEFGVGIGVVVDKDTAVVVVGNGRVGYVVRRQQIPNNARPGSKTEILSHTLIPMSYLDGALVGANIVQTITSTSS